MLRQTAKSAPIWDIRVENIAKAVSERMLDRITRIFNETTQAVREGSVAYATMAGLETVFKEEEIEAIFHPLPFVVLVSDEVRELNAKDFVSPVYGLSMEAQEYFEKQPKYTPERTYKIYGSDTDMKENLFKFIINNEVRNDSALIEVIVNLDGAINRFSMTPWGNESHIAVDAGGKFITRQRRSRDAPWE